MEDYRSNYYSHFRGKEIVLFSLVEEWLAVSPRSSLSSPQWNVSSFIFMDSGHMQEYLQLTIHQCRVLRTIF